MENRIRHFWFSRSSGLNFKPLDLGVAVRVGLGLALRSLPLAGVAIEKPSPINRGADQSSCGPGGFLLLKFFVFRIFELVLLRGPSGFIRIDPSEIKSNHANFNSKNPPKTLEV